MRCATLRVPLDRSGALPGSVDLRVARVRLSDARRPPYLMYLSGGPGGAGVVEMIDVLLELPRLTRDFTVLGFDQRGTGRSGLLRCREIERDERLRSTRAGERVRAPARRRGGPSTRRRTASRTWRRCGRRSARPKLTLFGISYGTELALAYARALPGPGRAADPRLRRRPGRDRPVRARRASARWGRRCARSARTAAAASRPIPSADLVALTARLRAAPLRGAWYDGRGRRHRGAVTPVEIADLLYDADYNPALRAARAGGGPGGAGPRRRRAAAAPARALARRSRRRRATSRRRATRRCARRRRCRGRAGRRSTSASRSRGERARAAARGVPPVRRRGRVRRRDRPVPALARSGAAAAAGRRRLSRPSRRCCSRARRTCARRPRSPRTSRR